jgi:hypothetical protein
VARFIGGANCSSRNFRHLPCGYSACYGDAVTQDTPVQEAFQRVQPVLSLRHPDGTMLEAALLGQESRLVSYRDGAVSEHQSIVKGNTRYVPYSARNNLLSRKVILLASCASGYGDERVLVKEVRDFIHRYVDLSPEFEEVAAHYVLLTWGYDAFNALPYLRVRGDYGSGKSRFLLSLGSLCYKPIFASGASTVSPLFRLMDEIGGTLIVDEADFRFSDERAEITKILNNGNARGFPVLRSEVTPSKEFNPRAFDIFGPKVIATRHAFQDEALESRCLTEDVGGRQLRADIPISLPKCFELEAQCLRNKLLQYRFDRFSNADEPPLDAEHGLSPRRAQVIAPLLRIATTDEAKSRILAFAKGAPGILQNGEREAQRRLLISIRPLLKAEGGVLSLSSLAKAFDDDWLEEYLVEATPRWIGSLLRGLGIEPRKSNGVFAIPSTAYPQLRKLIESRVGDLGDERDVNSAPLMSTEAPLEERATEGPLPVSRPQRP